MHSYNFLKRQWDKKQMELAVESEPFSEGSFRIAFKAVMRFKGENATFVCKFAKDTNTARHVYFDDVEAQVYAYQWSIKYCEAHPPQMITYVPAFVIEFVERPGRPLCGCERMIHGEFRKHNNNVGSVVCHPGESEKMDGLTAQAFSHFTYAVSREEILICDIQGVGGMYTDPQIHTVSGKGFGAGNLGQTGIRAFLLRHQCNEICAQFGFPAIKANQLVEKELDSQVKRSQLPAGNARDSQDPNKGKAAVDVLNLPNPQTLSNPYQIREIQTSTAFHSRDDDEDESDERDMARHSKTLCEPVMDPRIRQPSGVKTTQEPFKAVTLSLPPKEKPRRSSGGDAASLSVLDKGMGHVKKDSRSFDSAANKPASYSKSDLTKMSMTSMDEHLMDIILNQR